MPHPELSKTVLEGARRYASGRIGFGALAMWCEREGYKTPSGRRLTDEWWRNVLSNPLNAGYVGYHRKRGGSELRRASFTGFIPLDLFETIQTVRRSRAHRPGIRRSYRVFVLSGARCGSCGAKVTAAGNGRLRCRASAEHAGCQEPSVDAGRLEERFGEWLGSALTLSAALKVRLAALVRDKLSKNTDQESAAKIRLSIKRLTDAFAWGGLGEADYREQLVWAQRQLERVNGTPDERRIVQATRLAADVPTLWRSARPERRKELVATLFESITVAGGSVSRGPAQPRARAPIRGEGRGDYTSAVPTGFEPAISSLTGTYARPLHHGTMRCESVLCSPRASPF